MSKKLKVFLFLLITLLFPLDKFLHAQFVKDIGRQIEIPDITNLQSSETHLYVLSESEGLVVFRAHSDSLQWLYSSSGMQQRGHILESDIRFAYLYGNTQRLTVIEPTSVLGVYSSTVLPDVPKAAKRIGNDLFIAFGNSGFGRISLESPESVDAGIEIISKNQADDLVTDGRQTLFVLGDGNTVIVYNVGDEDISISDEVEINHNLNRLFLVENELMGSDSDGNVYLINSDGKTDQIADVGASVDKISNWNGRMIIRTENANLWLDDVSGNHTRLRSDGGAGNFFTVTESNLWTAEYDKVVPIIERDNLNGQSDVDTIASGNFRLREIKDVVLPFPHPLLLPVEFGGAVDPEDVSLSYHATFNNAQIRGSTFYWQPLSTQSGRHVVTVIASLADGRSDSTEFTVSVRPFNSPPRFSPARTISIPSGEHFELKVTAVDPDGINQNLIRYLGVDMPPGAQLNEQTGNFSWTPTIRQVGEHNFRVIATDQYGAAASQDYAVKVIEISEEPADEDLFDQ